MCVVSPLDQTAGEVALATRTAGQRTPRKYEYPVYTQCSDGHLRAPAGAARVLLDLLYYVLVADGEAGRVLLDLLYYVLVADGEAGRVLLDQFVVGCEAALRWADHLCAALGNEDTSVRLLPGY